MELSQPYQEAAAAGLSQPYQGAGAGAGALFHPCQEAAAVELSQPYQGAGAGSVHVLPQHLYRRLPLRQQRLQDYA